MSDARGVTGSPHGRSRARRRRGAGWRPALGAIVVAVLVAALPALWLAPASPGAVRVGGVSVEWWYGGLLAPVAGWAIAAWVLRDERDEPGGVPATSDALPDAADPDRVAARSVPSDPA